MLDYSSSLFHDKWRLLGRRLHPFTVGHALLLQRLGSPFASPSITAICNARVGDMATFLAIARRSYPRAQRLINGSTLVRFVVPLTAIRLLTARAQQSFIVGAYAYLCDAWTPPAMWSKAKASGGAPSDSLAVVVSTLRGGVGVPLDDILTTPLRQALHDACLHLASSGRVELMDANDEEMIRQADRLEAELRSQHAQG